MTNDTILPRRAPSGRFVLRIDPGLHASLRDAARAADTSLNSYCADKLASLGAGLDEEGTAVVRRAISVLGDSLLGVVVFGSWARSEDSPESDLDVLVVTDETIDISRALYRRWDSQPKLSWHGHRVSPHFVRLASEGAPISGFWAEVAMDGLVLLERTWAVSRHLAGVRRRILEGEITRRVVGGQVYWVRATS